MHPRSFDQPFGSKKGSQLHWICHNDDTKSRMVTLIHVAWFL